MKIFSRLLTIKHTHPYVRHKSRAGAEIDCDNATGERSSSSSSSSNISCAPPDQCDSTDEDADESSDEGCYLHTELDCARRLHKRYNLFYTGSRRQRQRQRPFGDVDPEYVALLRDNTLVSLANIAGALDLSKLEDEALIKLYAHGLLHWSICPSTEARDPMPTMAETSLISAQRLAIETLSKMTINDINVDLIMHTIEKMKPWLDSLVQILCQEWMPKRDEETVRELAIVLLTALAKCDQFAARSIAKHAACLLTFIEDFEENARRIHLHHQQQQHHHHHHHLDEDTLGTTVEMLRRVAKCLLYVTQSSIENARFIAKFEQRLLDLITSQFVDAKVSQLLAEVLFHCSK